MRGASTKVRCSPFYAILVVGNLGSGQAIRIHRPKGSLLVYVRSTGSPSVTVSVGGRTDTDLGTAGKNRNFYDSPIDQLS